MSLEKLICTAALTVAALSCVPKTASEVRNLSDDPRPSPVDDRDAIASFLRVYDSLKSMRALDQTEELCFKTTATARGLGNGAVTCGTGFINNVYRNIDVYSVQLTNGSSMVDILNQFTTNDPTNHMGMRAEIDIYVDLAAAIDCVKVGGCVDADAPLSDASLPPPVGEQVAKASLHKVYNHLKANRLLGDDEELCFKKEASARGIGLSLCGVDFIYDTYRNIDLYAVELVDGSGAKVIIDAFTTNDVRNHLGMRSEREIYAELDRAIICAKNGVCPGASPSVGTGFGSAL